MKARTSISIDGGTLRGAQDLARRRGVSLSALISEVLEDLVRRKGKRKKYPRTVLLSSGVPGLPLARDHEKYAFMEHQRK